MPVQELSVHGVSCKLLAPTLCIAIENLCKSSCTLQAPQEIVGL